MSKKPVVGDHAGHNYPRARVTKLTKETTKSLRCNSCQKLRFVTPIELRRASRPRCLGCGGALVEIEASVRRELGTKPQRKAAAKQTASAIQDVRERLKCWGCGFTGTGTHLALAHHLSNGRDCRREYVDSGKLMRERYIANCAFIEKIGTFYKVKAVVATTGEFVVIQSFKLYGEAIQLADELNGRPTVR